MLFGYPVEATEENWFHECLVEILRVIHTNPHQKPVWPTIIPATHRNQLTSRTGLRDRIIAYQEIVSSMNPVELAQVSGTLTNQNEIAQLLSCQCSCEKLDELPQAIQEPVKSLFKFGFGLLTDLDVRDHQYQIIYNATSHLCPFCGCEYFDAPGAPRQALDHYLAESKYTFAATNLKNLVPMGDKCNSKYKLAKDILYTEDGVTRRKAFYPYNHPGLRISLNRSKPFCGCSGIFSHTEWEIDFEPPSEEANTWDDVFNIRERYKRDILDQEFNSWLGDFAKWCRSAVVQANSMQDVVNALDRYAQYMESMGVNDRAFLKAAVFRMLYSECQKGNQRVIDIVSALVFGVEALL